MDGLEFDDRAVVAALCLAYPSSSWILLLLLTSSLPSSDDQGGLATLLDERGDVIMALILRPILLRGAMRRREEGCYAAFAAEWIVNAAAEGRGVVLVEPFASSSAIASFIFDVTTHSLSLGHSFEGNSF